MATEILNLFPKDPKLEVTTPKCEQKLTFEEANQGVTDRRLLEEERRTYHNYHSSAEKLLPLQEELEEPAAAYYGNHSNV